VLLIWIFGVFGSFIDCGLGGLRCGGSLLIVPGGELLTVDQAKTSRPKT
jgi:hypothetical protein